MNEIIGAAKGFGGKGFGYAKLKAQWQNTIVLLARTQLRGVKLPGGAEFLFHWREKDRRRDPDNIAAGGRKLVLDGLVAAEVLPGDGWDFVHGWRDDFEVHKTPGVLVQILT